MNESENSVSPVTNQVNISPQDVAKFWSKVAKAGPDECWLWTAPATRSGYGQFYFNGKHIVAHRFSYMIHCGPIPAGLFCCHKCDQRLCCNYNHIFIGTQADNLADMVAKGRSATGDKNGSRTHPEAFPKGEDIYCSKLTTDDVIQMRRLRSMGFKLDYLANIFGISKNNVCNVCKRRRWKHVP